MSDEDIVDSVTIQSGARVLTKPIPLIADDVCRVCLHGPHPGATCLAKDPPDINPNGYLCYCTEYVDLEAEAQIVVPRMRVPWHGWLIAIVISLVLWACIIALVAIVVRLVLRVYIP